MRRPARIARSVWIPAHAARDARAWRLILVAALFATAAAALVDPRPPRAAAQITVDDEDESQVTKVDIAGNAAYKDGTLKSIIRTHSKSFWKPWRSAPLRPDFLRFDRIAIRDFYRRRGYLSAEVESVAVTPTGKRKVSVQFIVREGPHAQINSIDFDGPSASDEALIRGFIPITAGGPFDFPSVEVSRNQIDSLYAERGNVAASIRDSVEVEGDDVRVRFLIDPGPVADLRSVAVVGTQATRPKFVAREVTLHPGDVLARSKLLKSQQRIYDSGLYNDVQFATSAIDSTTYATDLIVTVRERKLGWVDAGFGYGTVDQVRLSGQIGQRNLFREGVRVVGTGRVGIRGNTKPQAPYLDNLTLGERHADASLTRDWLLGYRVRGTIGAFAEDIPPKDSKTTIPLQAVGVTGGLRYEFNRWTSTSLAYEVRRVLSDNNIVVNQVGEPLNRYTKNTVSVTLDRDTRLDLFDPRNGSVATGTAALVGGAFRGNSRYVKLVASGTTYRPWSRRVTLAFRGRLGLITSGRQTALPDSVSDLELIPEDDRFRTGGATTVRGYQEDEIGTRLVHREAAPDTTVRHGGAYLIQGNAEIRTRLIGFLGAAAFIDAGGVWESASDISIKRTLSFSNAAGYNDMRWTAGLGVRIATPVGPVRLDYGWKLRIARPDEADPATGRGNFAFSLGQAY